MATRLHEQIKEHYVANAERHEVVVDDFRIDAIDGRGRLIEVQCASLSAIGKKIRTLLENHQVIVVKPLAARKKLVTLDGKSGDVVSSRFSPMKQTVAHVFMELVHFGVFPHPKLQLDILLTEQEEIRIPPTARSSWKKKYSVEERKLLSVQKCVKLKTAADLWKALDLDSELPPEFTTADLVTASGMPRWLAQKAAWCFRRMEFIDICGKQGNAVVYRLMKTSRFRKRRAA